MIEYARANAPDGRFAVGEMSEFVLGERFDAALCSFNSLNHARGERHLVRTLSNVRRHLLPNGYFLADLVLGEGYAHSWNRTATVDVEGGECELRFRYEPRRQRAFCDATVRRRGEAAVKVRMRQHVFTPGEIYAACAAAELKVIGLYPVAGDPPSGRVALLALRLG
jgi:SAM-dependent methyltransferase